jgi:hypothetical protein
MLILSHDSAAFGQFEKKSLKKLSHLANPLKINE